MRCSNSVGSSFSVDVSCLLPHEAKSAIASNKDDKKIVLIVC